MTGSGNPLLSALDQIPPLPQITTRAMTLMRDPHSSRSDLAHILSMDQGMTGVFLRMVNSAYYGLFRRITSLDEAIGYLGYDTAKGVIFALSARNILARSLPSYQIERYELWKHSLASAVGSDWIASKRRITPRNEVYVAGLLHDVGQTALDVMLEHQTYWQRDLKDETTQGAWFAMEREFTGYDHAEVGAFVVRRWNLSDRIVEAVAYHHAPERAEIDPRFTSAVHIANTCALRAGIGLKAEGQQYDFSQFAVDLLGWSDQDLEGLIGVMREAVEEAEQTLDIHG